MLWRLLIIASLGCGPAWAGCPPSKGYQSVPRIIGLPYPAARAWLTEVGFQPLLDWGRMQRDYTAEAEKWIAETGYFEVQACSGDAQVACRAHFVDKYRNLFRIVADPYESGWEVTDAFFVCGSDAATVFQPGTGE